MHKLSMGDRILGFWDEVWKLSPVICKFLSANSKVLNNFYKLAAWILEHGKRKGFTFLVQFQRIHVFWQQLNSIIRESKENVFTILYKGSIRNVNKLCLVLFYYHSNIAIQFGLHKFKLFQSFDFDFVRMGGECFWVLLEVGTGKV